MQKNKSFFISINRGRNEGYSVERLLDQKMRDSETAPVMHYTGSDGEEKLTINIYETDEDLIVRALVPGVSVDGIVVFVEDEVVTIRAKTEREALSQGTPLYEEHHWGSLSRSIMLPKRVKREGNSAELKNGVLTILLKKSLPRPPKKLNISSYD